MSHKLLLADDSVTIQRVIELTFADEDVEVVTAGDGEQAIASIRKERPDIVLADVGMPKRSGYDVAAFVKGEPELSHIPVLLLAGAFEPVDEQRAQAAGCDGVLVKPFEPQHVITRVRELLNGPHASISGAARAVSGSPRPAERPPAPRPQVTQRGGAGTDLDDYFDRLDAAFASLAAAGDPAAAGPSEPPPPRREGPVMEQDLDWFDSPQMNASPASTHGQPPPGADVAARATPPTGAPPEPIPVTFATPPSSAGWAPPSEGLEPRPAGRERAPQGAGIDQPLPQEPRFAIADAFSALLAAEQGEIEPGAVRLTLPGAPTAPTAVTDEFVEALTRRVAERLGSAALQDTIADLVSRVAERLVREEIERIRNKHRRTET